LTGKGMLRLRLGFHLAGQSFLSWDVLTVMSTLLERKLLANL
jgi:hypothetical protein